MSEPRLFVLDRVEDVSGVSGTGVVAEGIEFSDGVGALRWIVHPGRVGSGRTGINLVVLDAVYS